MEKQEAIICLKGIKNYARDTFTEDTDWQNSLDVAIKALEQVSTLDVVPVIHGKWIDGVCSNCNCDAPAYIIDWKWQKDMDAKWCPQCGAKMDN